MKYLMGCAFVTLLLLLSGCANKPQKTLEELNQSQAINKAASVRVYQNKSPEEVRKAAHQVLYLMDPNDIQFDIQGNKLLALRKSMFYGILSFTIGRDWYEIETVKIANGSTTTSFTFAVETSGGALGSISFSDQFKSNIPISAHDNPEDFNLFFDQLEYFLGTKKEWTTCEMAKARQVNKGQFLRLCGSLGLENYSPTDTIPTRPQIK